MEVKYILTVQQGPLKGEVYPVDADEFVIGRDSSADLELHSPSVSRRHARLIRQGSDYLLEDLGSSNGTFVNSEPIHDRRKLNNGDTIGLGQAILLEYHAPTPQAETKQQAQSIYQTEVAETPGQAGIAATVIGEDLEPPAETNPPELYITIAGQRPQVYTLTAEAYTLGRAEDNDIVIPSIIISGYHARLEHAGNGYRFISLPSGRNPVYLDGRKLSGSRELRHEDTMRIGSQDPGLMVTLVYHAPDQAAHPGVQTIRFNGKNSLQIGRDPGNDIVLDAPTVSRYHAQLERIGQRYRIQDLRSSNGTFVNDKQVEAEHWLKGQDTIRIGPYRFVMGQDELEQYDESSGLRVDAIGLNKWVRKDLNILQDISLVFKPREFIVIVGQSGGGKSTLVDAIAGYRPATHGQVLVNGIDVYRNFDAIRNEIGFVPQKDIIHMELTVEQALDYAARLRMPPDTTKAERKKRVSEVLEDLDLTHRKNVQISGLSGGQQKRVSIGVELLTKPGLFFLDEPTSGLDPGTETSLMQLMRRLADQGRTIVLITHATKNVMLADKVVFLARGGYLAWFGPPEEALQYFDAYRSERDRRAGTIEFDEIYAILDNPSLGSAQDWAKRYRQNPAYQRYIQHPLQDQGVNISAGGAAPPQTPAPTPKPPPRRNQVSALRQFFILSARNITILTRDRFSLVLMLAAAPVVGLLGVVLSIVLGRNPFSFEDGSFTTIMISLFLLGVYGVMVGGLSQMREFVKEAEIYRRERLVNLKILPYVLSKIWIAVLLALYQSLAYEVIHYLAFDMPGGAFSFLIIFISLTLATLAGMMLGLFASALAPNANSVPLLLIILMIPQIVLGGAMIPLPGYVSAITSTRWAFEAFMGTSGVGEDVAADRCWNLPLEVRSLMTFEEKENFQCNCLGTQIFQEGSCEFPGLGEYYDPALDESPPVEPNPLADPPAEPEIPPPPPEPLNQADTVAMAEYLGSLREYQGQVEQIQNDYKAQVEDYQARAAVYQAEAIAYQENLARYQIARNAAVGKGEGLIQTIYKDYGWTFVDTSNPQKFWPKILNTWIAQGVIISLFFVGTLILIKRRDRVK